MSLLRLLTAGKSLVGLRDSEPRYRLNRQRLLPKFPMRENPFRATVKPDGGRDCASPVARPAENGVPAVGARRPEESELHVAPMPEVQSGPENLARKWISKLRGLRGRNAQGFARRAPQSDSAPGAVQTELSLDSVEVMRNDLSDADFEVVPSTTVSAKVPTRPAERDGSDPKPEKVEAGELPSMAWGRVSRKLFPAGKP
jgi:hypothetical protein